MLYCCTLQVPVWTVWRTATSSSGPDCVDWSTTTSYAARLVARDIEDTKIREFYLKNRFVQLQRAGIRACFDYIE